MRSDIQILRGIAVVMVVLFHLQAPYFSNGFLGVDVFFVISGYLMVELCEKTSTFEFYKRRVRRLLPAYAVTVCTAVVVGIFRLVPSDFYQLYEQSVASIFFINNIEFWRQNGYFDKSAFNPLLNLWSLSLEVQFYLLVPFLYPILKKNKALFYFVFVTSLATCFFVQTIQPKFSFYLLPFRVWEFLAGAWVAWNKSRPSYEKNALKFLPIALLCAIFFIAPMAPESRSIAFGHPGAITFFVVATTAAIIYYGLHRACEYSSVGRIVAIVGDYSYSIYLVHFPAIVLWNYEYFGGTVLTSSGSVGTAFLVVLIIVMSVFWYRIVEKQGAALLLSRDVIFFSIPIFVFAISALSLRVNESKYTAIENNIFLAFRDRSEFRCGEFYWMTHRGQELCLLSREKTKKSILLIGNSHADSIKSSFLKSANNNGFSLYFTSSNAPLMEERLSASKIMSEALANDIGGIVVHFSPSVYDGNFVPTQLIKLAKMARTVGIGLAVISPVPTYKNSVPKEMFLSNGSMNSIFIDRSMHDQRIKSFYSLAEILSDENVRIYDPAETFCPSNARCSVANTENKPYYFDDGHLTLTGAAQLEPMFNKLLKAM